MADIRDILDHCYAAKQHLVNSILGTHKGDLECGMLTQWPVFDITHSNHYQVREHINKVKYNVIQSG
jgi:hypothetical protein